MQEPTQRAVARSDPKGLLVFFEAGGPARVTRVELDLLEDGEPAVVFDSPDARYIRALSFKPVVDRAEPFTLQLRAFDALGCAAVYTSPVPVTVVK